MHYWTLDQARCHHEKVTETPTLTLKLLCTSPFSIVDTQNEHFPSKPIPLPIQLLDNKSRSKVLSRRIIRILKMLSIDTKSMRCITDSIALFTLVNAPQNPAA